MVFCFQCSALTHKIVQISVRIKTLSTDVHVPTKLSTSKTKQKKIQRQKKNKTFHWFPQKLEHMVVVLKPDMSPCHTAQYVQRSTYDLEYEREKVFNN